MTIDYTAAIVGLFWKIWFGKLGGLFHRRPVAQFRSDGRFIGCIIGLSGSAESYFCGFGNFFRIASVVRGIVGCSGRSGRRDFAGHTTKSELWYGELTSKISVGKCGTFVVGCSIVIFVVRNIERVISLC